MKFKVIFFLMGHVQENGFCEDNEICYLFVLGIR